MSKLPKTLLSSAVVTALTLASAATLSAEMTKPAGASGGGEAAVGQVRSNQFWWPDQLDLAPLRDHDARSNPLGEDFSYADAFNQLVEACFRK